MKGIILAGGKGSRLAPLTSVISKQLLPIYDKPMIYYPMSILMLAGIRDILIITTKDDLDSYKILLGDGKKLGISISYEIQEYPKGLAEAFIIGESFIVKQPVCLILGDNILYGQDLSNVLRESVNLQNGALIYGYPVKNPKEFGVVEFDSNLKVLSLEEKPQRPKSEFAIPGIYFYDHTVVVKAKQVKPSNRNELEITSLNEMYLNEGTLNVKLLGRGFAWLDTGTIDSMKSASEFVEAIQKRQGFYVSCIEEIAWRKGYISTNEFQELGNKLSNSDYGKYILSLIEDHQKKESL
jgi:glucose-1-phosphate thymidylyltransferase